MMNQYEKRTLKKRMDILTVTMSLVSSIPTAKISIQKISSCAKVSPVTIYNIFGSKRALITEAIMKLSIEDIEDIYAVISSNLPIVERLTQYFTRSFLHTVKRPEMKAILEYIFSGVDQGLLSYVGSQYVRTMPHLTRLYTDGRKENLIRENITLEQFMRMLDIYTRIDRPFLIEEKDREVIITCIIRSFS